MNRRHFLRHCGVVGEALAGASSLPWLSGCASERVRRTGVPRAYAAPDISFTGSARAAVRALPEKLVFNCTELGAKALFDDKELRPVKGQLTFLLPQPEVQYATLAGDLYMFPRSDGILRGGTHEKGVWSLEPNLHSKAEILAAHQAFFAGFRG